MVLRNYQQEKAQELALKALRFQHKAEEDGLFCKMETLPSQASCPENQSVLEMGFSFQLEARFKSHQTMS